MSGTKITPKKIVALVFLAVIALFSSAILAAESDSCGIGGCKTSIPKLWVTSAGSYVPQIQNPNQLDDINHINQRYRDKTINSKDLFREVANQFNGNESITSDFAGEETLQKMAKNGQLEVYLETTMPLGGVYWKKYDTKGETNLSSNSNVSGYDLALQGLDNPTDLQVLPPWLNTPDLRNTEQQGNKAIMEKLTPLIADFKNSPEGKLLSPPPLPSQLVVKQCVHPLLGESTFQGKNVYGDPGVYEYKSTAQKKLDLNGDPASKEEDELNYKIRQAKLGHYSIFSTYESIPHTGQKKDTTIVAFDLERAKGALWTTDGTPSYRRYPSDYWRRVKNMLDNGGTNHTYPVKENGPYMQPFIYNIDNFACDKGGNFVEVVKDGDFGCDFKAFKDKAEAETAMKKANIQPGSTCKPDGNIPNAYAPQPGVPNSGNQPIPPPLPGNNAPVAPIPPPQTIPPPGQPNTPPGSPNLGGGGNNGGGNNGGGNNGGGQDGGLGDVMNKLMQALKGLGQGGQQNQQPQQTSNPYNDPNFACQQDTQKVCGADYKTYANSCMANRYQTSVKHLGVCTDAEKLMASNKTTGDTLQELVAQLSSSGIPTQLIQDLVSIISKSTTNLFTGSSSVTESVVK